MRSALEQMTCCSSARGLHAAYGCMPTVVSTTPTRDSFALDAMTVSSCFVFSFLVLCAIRSLFHVFLEADLL